MKIPVVGGTYDAYSRAENDQRCVNWYPAPDPRGANNNGFVLNPTPGLDSLASGSGVIRGAHWMAGQHYMVQGTALYRISSGGTLTSLGTVGGAGRVSMSDDGTRLTITTGATGYQWNEATDTFQTITDADFVSNYRHNRNLSTYTIYAGGNGGQFQISNPLASEDIDGLDFATAESYPDDIVALEVNNRLVYFFGERGVEIWQLSGGIFPFTAVTGAYIERGCVAEWSVEKLDGKVFWLGDDLNVYYLVGYERIGITPPGIAEILRNEPYPEDAYAYSYIQGGHAFYCLSLTNTTIVYDIITKEWHERGSWLGSENGKWSVTHLTDNNGTVYAYRTGNVYKVNPDSFYEGSDIIIRDRITQDISGEGRRVKQPEIQFLVDPGKGLEDQTVPYLQLRWSDDQGYSWSNEQWLSMGKEGEYRNRCKKNRLGSFLKTRRYWVRASSPARPVILDCWGEFV